MSAVQPFAGRDVARHVRKQGDAALARTPPADRLVWGLSLVILALVAGLTAGGAWWAHRPPPPPTSLDMRVGSERLVVPSDYLGPRRAETGREVGMVRLRLTWPELKPPIGGDKAEVHLTIRPADPDTDPTAQFAKLARFLEPGAWSNPGGLVARNFKKGSPFEHDELYLSLPDGQDFFARCTADIGATRLDEGCRAVLKHGPFDLALRFPRDALVEWRALSDGARGVVDRLRAQR